MSIENILKPHNLTLYLNEVADKSIKVSNIDSENTLANYVITSDGAGNATWEDNLKDRVLASRTQPYNFPTVSGNVVFNVENLPVQYSLNTSTGVISLNNTANEVISLDFMLSASVSDSTTKFRFTIQTDSGGGVILATIDTPLEQNGSTNEPINISMSTMFEFEPSSTITVRSNRIAGIGTLSVSTQAGGVDRPHCCSLRVVEV